MTPSPIEADHARLHAIVRKLLEQTESGNVVWEESGGNAYTYSTRNSSVTISCVDGDDRFPFTVYVSNSMGRTVTWMEFQSGDNEGGNEVHELYALAARSNLNVDETLDGILKDLGGMPPF